MAKISGPLLSLGARGTIGKTMTLGSWRGVPYARQYVVPANPNSDGQKLTRNVFRWLTNVWKVAGTIIQDPWDTYASGQPLTGRNAFIGQNVKASRTKTDLSALIVSAGASGGIPPVSVISSGTSAAIVFTLSNPDPPTDWTLAGATMFAVPAQNPQSGTEFTSYNGTIDTPFTTGTLAVDTTGTMVTSAFLVWTKPDKTTAYSPGINGTAVVT